MRKHLVVLLLIALAAAFCFAEGQQEGVEKVELRYMMWDPQIIEKEQALAVEFSRAHPNVSVTIETAAFAQFWEKMQAMAAAKNMPDVFWMSSAYVKDYQRMGAILNLEKYIAGLNKDDYFESIFNVLRSPTPADDMYAFPWAWVSCISYYNKRLFDEAGLPYPGETWTWDEMRDLALKLTKDTDGDGAADQWGYWVKGRYTHLYPFVYNNGVETGVTDEKYEKFQLDTGAGREAMKFLADLITADKVSPTPAQTKGVSTFFTTGRIGICTEGSWRIDTYRKSLEDPFGITLVPLGPESGGKQIVYGWADAMAISAFTEHPREAWDWMMFMCGPGRPVDSILGGKVPIWKGNALSDAWLERDMLPENKELVLKSGELIGAKVTMSPHWEEWNSVVQSDFEKIVLGEGDFDQVMAELKVKVEKILAR